MNNNSWGNTQHGNNGSGNGCNGGCNNGCNNGCGNGSGNNSVLGEESCISGSHQLAMVYSPCQMWRMLYSPETALERGTLFEELDKPLEDCVNE